MPGRHTKADYRHHYRTYQSKPSVKKKRAKNNAARRKMIKAGKAKKGDGKDVHHKKPLRKGGSNKMSNLSVTSRKKNRGHGASPGKRGKKARK